MSVKNRPAQPRKPTPESPGLPKPVLCKSISQVNYKPELRFYEHLFPAARQLTEYADWETDGHLVILRDFIKHCSVSIKFDLFAYEQDSNDADLDHQRSGRVWEVLSAALQLDSFARFGFRQFHLIPVTMNFASLVAVLNKKLLSQHEDLLRVLPPTIEDLMYRVDCADESVQYHLTAGPVKASEIPQYVAFNQRNHLHPKTREDEYRSIREKYPDAAVFLDIDIYKAAETLSPQSGAEFWPAARNKMSELVNGFNRYLFSTVLEQ